MKTNSLFPFMLAVCLMSFSTSMFANVRMSSLPIVRFFNTDTVVVVSPENCKITPADKADIEKAVFWDNFQTRPVYRYKSERELTKKDAQRHLLIVGCIHQFQRTSLFQIPVTKARKGFRVDNRQFDSPQDSFFYINPGANRMYLCKNSPEARHAFFTIGGTPYPLHVFRNDRLVLTGYAS